MVTRRIRTRPIRIVPLSAQVGIGTSAAFSVALSVLLISVAFGVHDKVLQLINDPRVYPYLGPTSIQINRILVQLTVVVTVGIAVQAAATTYVLGQTVMRSQKEKVRGRREAGTDRSRIFLELMVSTTIASFSGALFGETIGMAATLLLRQHPGLPVTFNAVSLCTAFPVTIALADAAMLVPAWLTANQSTARIGNDS